MAKVKIKAIAVKAIVICTTIQRYGGGTDTSKSKSYRTATQAAQQWMSASINVWRQSIYIKTGKYPSDSDIENRSKKLYLRSYPIFANMLK